jgi:hypothetical protein
MSKAKIDLDGLTSIGRRMAMPPSAGPRYCFVIALVLGLAYAFAGAHVDDFCLDDAWIHLAYAKSLRLGDGLSYNPGDWETGFSSPAWVLLLAAWPTEAAPVAAVKLLGVLLHAASSALAAAIVLDLVGQRSNLLRPLPAMSMVMLGGIVCATSPALLQGATSGMEVPLTTCLLLACLRACLRRRWLIAGVLGFAVELARPEALACLLGFSLVLWFARRKREVLAPVLGATLGLGCWVGYCAIVSGYPWPNTAYVKAGVGQAGFGTGLEYLYGQVLSWEPWVAGVGGLALLLAALWSELTGRGVLERDGRPPDYRRWELVAVFVGYLGGMLGVAFSRPLEPGILFYQGRYFAIFAGIPPVLIAFGLARTHRLLALVLLVPVALVLGLAIPTTARIQRAQERGVRLLHSDPARFVSRELPRDAVIAVEGAGAMRARTPRSMTIVDVIGLNTAAIAHAADDGDKVCVIIQRGARYLLLPEHIAAALTKVFDLELLAEFVDPEWAQIEEPREVRVVLLEIVGVHTGWRARCGLAWE